MRPLSSLFVLATVLMIACGGPPPGGTHDPSTKGTSAADPTSKPGGDTTSAEPAARRPLCEDAACFTCGEGICPVGYYCERSKKNAPLACASVAKCAEKPTCACLKPYIGGCSCEDKGGPLVQCD